MRRRQRLGRLVLVISEALTNRQATHRQSLIPALNDNGLSNDTFRLQLKAFPFEEQCTPSGSIVASAFTMSRPAYLLTSDEAE